MTAPKFWGVDGEFMLAEPAPGDLVGVTIITAEWTGTGTLTADDRLVPVAVYYRAGWEAGWAAHSELDRLAAPVPTLAEALALAARPTNGDAPEEPSPSRFRPGSFAVLLETAGPNKIPVIKALRDAAGIGLREAKEIVDQAPGAFVRGIARDQAREIVSALCEAGATAEVRPMPRHA